MTLPTHTNGEIQSYFPVVGSAAVGSWQSWASIKYQVPQQSVSSDPTEVLRVKECPCHCPVPAFPLHISKQRRVTSPGYQRLAGHRSAQRQQPVLHYFSLPLQLTPHPTYQLCGQWEALALWTEVNRSLIPDSSLVFFPLIFLASHSLNNNKVKQTDFRGRQTLKTLECLKQRPLGMTVWP